MALPVNPCVRCGHTWHPRADKRSGVCPNCKSPHWDQPRVRQVSKRQAEIVCPWCGETCPLTGDEERPIPFAEQYGDFETYRCDCGSLGSPSGDMGEAGLSLDDVEAALAAILKIERGEMETRINHVTHTRPALLMVWGRERREGK